MSTGRFKKLCVSKRATIEGELNAHNTQTKCLKSHTLTSCKIQGNDLHVRTVNATTARITNLEATNANVQTIRAQVIQGDLVTNGTDVLGDPTTDLRQQFTPQELVRLLETLINARLEGRSIFITLPDYDWTGTTALPSDRNLPVKTINTGALSNAEVLEEILVLGLLIIYSTDTFMRFYASSTDVLNSNPLGWNNYIGYVQSALQLVKFVQDSLVFAVTDPERQNRQIAIRLLVAQLSNTLVIISDDHYIYDNSFDTLYSSIKHQNYSAFYNADVGSYNYIPWLAIGYLRYGSNVLWTDLGYSENIGTMFPHILQRDIRFLKAVLRWEREGLGTYFWPKLTILPEESVVLQPGRLDAEGLVCPALNVPAYLGFDLTFLQDQPNSMLHEFKDLKYDSFIGPIIYYEDDPETGVFGIKTLLTDLLGEERAESILRQAEALWNHEYLPLLRQLKAVIDLRIAQASDDDYPGAWRAKFPVILRVHRGALAAYAFDIPSPWVSGVAITIPLNAVDNNDPQYLAVQAIPEKTGQSGAEAEALLLGLFEEAQAKIAEMDQLSLDQLEVIQDVHVGDDFIYLKKQNTNLGYNFQDVFGQPPIPYETPGQTPSQVVSAVIQNYTPQKVTIAQQEDLIDAVLQSGLNLTNFFFDIKGYLAKVAATELGLNTGNFDLIAAEVNRANLSIPDIYGLGRHYGYNVDGTIKVDEWVTPGVELLYGWNTNFDYIYRQHYRIDGVEYGTNPAILRPDQITIGGQRFVSVPLDQFVTLELTDSSQIRLEILQAMGVPATTPIKGTYLRWKYDYLMQRIAEYIIATSQEKNLLQKEYADKYFRNTFINTNKGTYPLRAQSDHPLPSLPITVAFKVAGQAGGSAFSESLRDLDNRIYYVSTTFPTYSPTLTADSHNRPLTGSPSPLGDTGTILHEAALGHGFETVDNNYNFIESYATGQTDLPEADQRSWISNVNTYDALYDNSFVNRYEISGTSVAVLTEGWATFGELLGLTNEYYVYMTTEGEVDTARGLNVETALMGQIALSRIAGRQVNSITLNFSRYAWSLYRVIDHLYQSSNIPTTDGFFSSIVSRFIMHPMQQTSYATGLIANLALYGELSRRIPLELPGQCFDLGKFVQFRIQTSDYLTGTLLTEYVEQLPLTTFSSPCM